ncbi:hypothetical protein Slin14017_G110830 [Septoria linicola]|nr:hypothetical protein Slin14017_G110830 [Septoria linicola]
MQLFALIAALVAFATAQELAGYPSCTKTHTPTSYTCCGDIAAVTATSYTNCGGCALKTEANFPACRCATPPVTVATLTSTRTACAPTTTQSIKTIKKPNKCTKTITKVKPGCGDCGHVFATTKTTRIDCGGCALKTKTITGEAGICMCPTETATTVTACKKSGY